jgi:TRAP-type mannitol/chloroaromatic compound transport system permease small subunit
VQGLLALSRWIDRLNELVGRHIAWCILASVLISAVNASVRKAFDVSSNAWLELQWYLFSAVFLLAAGYTLLRGEHVRIDILFNVWPRRVQLWIELFGTIAFLLPLAGAMIWLSWPVFVDKLVHLERSPNAGGLLLWPVIALVPLGFVLLGLQGISELIKRIAWLRGDQPDPGAAPAAHGEGA